MKQPIQITYKGRMGEFTITASTIQEIRAAYAIIEKAAEPRTRVVLTERKPKTDREMDAALSFSDYTTVHLL